MNLKKTLSNKLHRLAFKLEPKEYTRVDTPFFTPEPEDAVIELSKSAPVWTPEQEDGVVIVEPKIISMERAEHGEEDLSKVSKPF
jgi:hypothetical protein